MSERAVLTDRGYQPYGGPRLGTSRAVRAIIRDGVRRALGLRRKARRKVLPWLLIGMTWMMTCIYLIIIWFQDTTSIQVFDNAYTALLGSIILFGLIFTSYAAPEMLVPDRTSGVLNVYFSRPLRVGHYLAAKGGALAAVIFGFWTGPLLFYHLGLAFLSREGFASYLGSKLEVLWQIPAVALCYMFTYGSVALVCAALFKRVAAATAVCIGLIFSFNIAVTITVVFSETTARWLSLLAFEQHVTNLREWIFGEGGAEMMQRVGLDPWVSALVIAVLTAVAALLVKLSYRKPV